MTPRASLPPSLGLAALAVVAGCFVEGSTPCRPGEVLPCTCAPGLTGAQRCAEDGRTWVCACPAFCGDQRCDRGESCETCPADCGGCYCGDGLCSASAGEVCETCSDCACSCGDGRCNAGETCESCAGDCGACWCGDGLCSRGAGERCDECAPDCGACRCGDGVCNGAETCGSCASDCCPPGSECSACTSSADCGSGTSCSWRLCDGQPACYLPEGSCAAVSGLECPPTSTYARCDPAAASCGPNAFCVDPYPAGGPSVCGRSCTSDGDCLSPPGITARPRCVSLTSGSRACLLGCVRGDTCPTNQFCVLPSGSSDGICEPYE